MNGIEIVWSTPIGFLTARISEAGVRSLRFGEPAAAYPLNEEPVRIVSRPEEPGPYEEHIRGLHAFLEGYFAGRPCGMPRLDLSDAAPFDRKVLEACAKIGFGRTTTYGDLAREVGTPGGSRAVGGAMRRNRHPLLVPCHRVLARGGRLGGFSGGLGLKNWLLSHEFYFNNDK